MRNLEERIQMLNLECGPCEIHKLENFSVFCSKCFIHLEREKAIQAVMETRLEVKP